MVLNQIQKIPLCVFGQRGFVKMRVGAQIGLRFDIHVGEIATPAARDADFLAWFVAMINDQN